MRARLQTPLSASEKARVEKLASACGLTVAEYVRMRLGLTIKRPRGRPPIDRATTDNEPAGR